MNWSNINNKFKVILVVTALILISGLVYFLSDNHQKPPENQESTSLNHTTQESNMPQNTKYQLEKFRIGKPAAGTYEIESVNFDLGSEVLLSATTEVSYNLRGVISAPIAEGKYPVVIIAHGSHENLKDDIRFDTGFQYLCEALAQNGYIALSVDLNAAYLWKYGENDMEKLTEIVNKHVEKLKSADQGETTAYQINLENRIDFDNLFLIGHSRAGTGIFEVVEYQQNHNQPIKGILSLAPAISILKETFPNVNTAILMSEYDGDISDGQGITLFNKMTKNNNQLLQLTLLEKANHNYYNRDLKRNDSEFLFGNYANQLTREEQEDFLVNFTLDFLNALSKGDDFTWGIETQAPRQMYGKDVVTVLNNPNAVSLFDKEDVSAFIDGSVIIEILNDSWFYADDQIPYFDSITSGMDEYKINRLMRMTWKEKDEYKILIPAVTDFSEYESLNIKAAQPPNDENNTGKQYQSFSVMLKDTSGNIAAAVLSREEGALRYIEGEAEVIPVTDLNYYHWSMQTPITDIRIPLKYFESIDLKNIENVTFLFNQNNSGAIIVEDISLMK